MGRLIQDLLELNDLLPRDCHNLLELNDLLQLNDLLLELETVASKSA